MSNISSYQEKSAWVQMLAILLVLGGYSTTVFTRLGEGVLELQAYRGLLLGAAITLMIVTVAGHIFAALMATPEHADERDQLIALKEESRSSWLLATGVLAAILNNFLQILAYRRGG